MRSPHSLRRNPIPSAKPTAQSRATMAASSSIRKIGWIGMWPIGQDIRDFVVAIKDRFDGTQLGAVLVQRRLTATEDQRYPFVRVNKAGGGDECRDQAVDR